MTYREGFKLGPFLAGWLMSLAVLFILVVSPTSAASPRINEIRIDQPGIDNDEYFEIFGDPSGSLNDLTYIVIGDGDFP